MKQHNLEDTEIKENGIQQDDEDYLNPESIPSLQDVVKEQVEEIEEASKDRTPKLGKKSKKAIEAEEQKLLISTCQSFFEGIHEYVTEKFGQEFRHEDEEITTLAILTSAVISKYVDLNGLQYKEEIQLGTYLIGKEFPKVSAFIERKRKEAQQELEEMEEHD